jgi:Pyridoxamine 5'-phosphate oxidase
MTIPQGDLALLEQPIAQQLLTRQTVLRLAYTWTDGSPRVVPHWFVWNGHEIVLGTQNDAPKIRALQRDPRVAVTIDTIEFPPRVLLVRGIARLEVLDGVAPEYTDASRRYFGPEQGEAWVQRVAQLAPANARIAITPTWAGLLDYETCFPSVVARALHRVNGNTGYVS